MWPFKKKLALNLSVGINHNGKHYPGIAVHDGVAFDLIDSPCGPGRQLVSLTGCKEGAYPTGIFWDTTSCSNDKGPAVGKYLQVKPA